MSVFIWKLLHMLLSCNQIFCHTFEEIFYANFDAHMKKLLKQKNSTNFRQSILSMFFKAKIEFGDLQIAGKQCTINHEFARQKVKQKA